MDNADELLARFNRLMRECERGSAVRNCFRPWEVELLIDLYASPVALRRRLREKYQKAVRRQIENGAAEPQKFSEFLRRHDQSGAPPERPAAPVRYAETLGCAVPQSPLGRLE